NNAVFWEMESNWPLQSAQPRGGKLKANRRISPRNGLDIILEGCGVSRERFGAIENRFVFLQHRVARDHRHDEQLKTSNLRMLEEISLLFQRFRPETGKNQGEPLKVRIQRPGVLALETLFHLHP